MNSYKFLSKTIKKHPAYISKQKYNDIALFELEDEVLFTDYIMPVCLQCEKDVDSIGRELIISGWGYTDREQSNFHISVDASGN